MTLYRTVLLAVLAAASTSAFAADPGSPALNTSDAYSWQVAGSANHVPWFTGKKQEAPGIKSDQSSRTVFRRGGPVISRLDANGDSCYTLRTYMVKRQERFSENEPGVRGYTTCQMASNYQVRSAVAVQKLQAPPQ